MAGPLRDLVAALVRQDGPIGVDRFMALALGHPAHGYYMTRDPFGTAGDFTTAPEISQMFGELVGLWCAAVWQGLGAPDRFALVELGPGRGTLMADLLRATRIVPGFRAAAALHLVETSPVLRDRQAATLAASGASPAWHDGIETLPGGPAIVVANEFFDALPVRQWVRAEGRWRERLVGLDAAGALAFGLAPEPDPALALPAPDGTLLEVGLAGQAVMAALARRLAAEGGAALVVDYGSARPTFGATLQAVRAHAPADPLADPGGADLTAHVDFTALARAAQTAGAVAHGPARQGDFLRALGIESRAAALARGHPDQAEAIRAALARLTGPEPGMGELFKVMAVTAGAASLPGLPPPADPAIGPSPP